MKINERLRMSTKLIILVVFFGTSINANTLGCKHEILIEKVNVGLILVREKFIVSSNYLKYSNDDGVIDSVSVDSNFCTTLNASFDYLQNIKRITDDVVFDGSVVKLFRERDSLVCKNCIYSSPEVTEITEWKKVNLIIKSMRQCFINKKSSNEPINDSAGIPPIKRPLKNVN